MTIMMMALSDPQDLASLLVKVALLLDTRQLKLGSLQFRLKITICRFEILPLLQTFAATVLSVATIL